MAILILSLRKLWSYSIILNGILENDKFILKVNVTIRSCMRERRTYGFVRGLRREPLVYLTAGTISGTKIQ